MKPICVWILLILLVWCSTPVQAQGQANGIQVTASGIFSFTGPPGWTLQNNPGQQFEKLVAPGTGNQWASIDEATDPSTASLGQYALFVVASLSAPANGLLNVELMSAQPLQTQSGQSGLRVVLNETLQSNNTALVQVIYFFKYSKGKLVLTGTFYPLMENQYLPMIDSAMSSLKTQ